MISFINSFRKGKVIECLKKDSDAIVYASKRLKDDYDVAKMVIDTNPMNIKHLSEKIRDNRDLMFYSMDKSSITSVFASNRIKNLGLVKEVIDTGKSLRLIIKEKVISDTGVVKELPTFLLKDEEFMKELMELNGEVLKYTLPSHRKSREMVSIAIENSPFALRHAHPSIREDMDLVFKAVAGDTDVVSFLNVKENIILNKIAEEHISLKEAILKLEKQGIDLCDYVTQFLFDYLEEDQNFRNLQFMKENCYSIDRNCVLKELKEIEKNPRHYLLVKDTLKMNKKFALEALKYNWEVLHLIPKSFLNSKEFMMEAAKITSKALLFLEGDLAEDKNFILDTIRNK